MEQMQIQLNVIKYNYFVDKDCIISNIRNDEAHIKNLDMEILDFKGYSWFDNKNAFLIILDYLEDFDMKT